MKPAIQPCTAFSWELAPDPAIVPVSPSPEPLPSAAWEPPPQAVSVSARALAAERPAVRRLISVTFVLVSWSVSGCCALSGQLVPTLRNVGDQAAGIG